MTCSDPALETGDSNLVLRAANLLKAQTGCDKGVRVHLEKGIPVAGGMAGGSVDAAAALSALNELWDLGLSCETLAAYALELGSDVPYCLTGGTAAATGRGETIQSLPPLTETWFVLLRPALGISASDVYNHPALTRNAETPVDGRTPAFSRALNLLEDGRIADLMFNRMESAIFAMHPELAESRDRLLDAGCSAAIVSGSGPTIVGLCEDGDQATSVAAELEARSASCIHSVPVSLAF
jgi:4-diphosphocytidyl-2-C-methyl-D-erythritol kinase